MEPYFLVALMSCEIVSSGFPIDGFKLFMYTVVACKRWSFFRKRYLQKVYGLGRGGAEGKQRWEKTNGRKQRPGGQAKTQRKEGEMCKTIL